VIVSDKVLSLLLAQISENEHLAAARARGDGDRAATRGLQPGPGRAHGVQLNPAKSLAYAPAAGDCVVVLTED
jgi:hypothetical protein